MTKYLDWRASSFSSEKWNSWRFSIRFVPERKISSDELAPVAWIRYLWCGLLGTTLTRVTGRVCPCRHRTFGPSSVASTSNRIFRSMSRSHVIVEISACVTCVRDIAGWLSRADTRTLPPSVRLRVCSGSLERGECRNRRDILRDIVPLRGYLP